MMVKRITYSSTFWLMLAILFTGQLFAQPTTKVGTTAAQFLKMGVHPRGVAMGEAFVGLGDDISALFWNPAGIARSNNRELSFSHSNWFADIGFYYAAASASLGRSGNIGLAVTHVDYGEMDIRTEKQQDGTGERFSAGDISMALSYARNLTDRFSIGGSVKYIQQQIWHMTAPSMAVDLGVLFITQFKDIRLGMSITNFGLDMTLRGRNTRVTHDPDPTMEGNNDQINAHYELDSWPLPLSFRVGIAGNIINSRSLRWLFAIDALHPNDNSEYVNLGTEVGFSNMLFIRAGFRTLFVVDREGGPTLGAGIRWPMAPGVKIKVDYSWADYGLLHNTQRLALSVEY